MYLDFCSTIIIIKLQFITSGMWLKGTQNILWHEAGDCSFIIICPSEAD